jgi:hypothetical protein
MPPVSPPRAGKMVFMGNGDAAYGLVLTLIEGMNHLSTLQQAAHVMSPEDIERHEEVLVSTACKIYTSLTGVHISEITTFRNMDALKEKP